MAGYTTAFTTAAKAGLMAGALCLAAPITKTGVSGVSGAFTLTGLADVSGIYVGMAVTGTNVASGAVVASIDSTTQVTLSKAHTGTITTASITFTGDTINVVLGKASPTGTYDATTTKHADITGNSDEVSGTGYTAGGAALTNNGVATSGTTAYADFADASWTSASFSARAAFLEDITQRGPTVKPVISVHDFGGTQTVSSGTFTLVFPTPDSSNAILRVA
jgi:hypothetical protein